MAQIKLEQNVIAHARQILQPQPWPRQEPLMWWQKKQRVDAVAYATRCHHLQGRHYFCAADCDGVNHG